MLLAGDKNINIPIYSWGYSLDVVSWQAGILPHKSVLLNIQLTLKEMLEILALKISLAIEVNIIDSCHLHHSWRERRVRNNTSLLFCEHNIIG